MASASGEILDQNAAAERLLGGNSRGAPIADAIAVLVPDAQREPIPRRARARRRDARAPRGPVRDRSPADTSRCRSADPGDRGAALGQVAMCATAPRRQLRRGRAAPQKPRRRHVAAGVAQR